MTSVGDSTVKNYGFDPPTSISIPTESTRYNSKDKSLLGRTSSSFLGTRADMTGNQRSSSLHIPNESPNLLNSLTTEGKFPTASSPVVSIPRRLKEARKSCNLRPAHRAQSLKLSASCTPVADTSITDWQS